MAVYKRSYRAYEGGLTPRWSRFLILTRYAAKGVFQSRIMTGLFVISFFYPLFMIGALYLNHNTRVLSLLKINSDQLMNVNGMFFFVLMSVQASFAFLMTAFIGPGTIAPDLANNALPLYFCRPLSRTEYVLGRACVIFSILSFITWIPGLVIFGVESNLSGAKWAWEHRNFAFGIVVGSWLWLLVLTLLALAISAWVRWRLVAGALLLAVMFASSGFAAAINEVLRIHTGFYLDPANLVAAVWANFFDIPIHTDISPFGACIAIGVICALCVLLLSRKVRAFEVVR
jgi:ABC-2 type transport system permease protein